MVSFSLLKQTNGMSTYCSHLLRKASSQQIGSSSSRGLLPPHCVISVARFSSTYPDRQIPVSKPSDTRIHLSNAISVWDYAGSWGLFLSFVDSGFWWTSLSLAASRWKAVDISPLGSLPFSHAWGEFLFLSVIFLRKKVVGSVCFLRKLTKMKKSWKLWIVYVDFLSNQT